MFGLASPQTGSLLTSKSEPDLERRHCWPRPRRTAGRARPGSVHIGQRRPAGGGAALSPSIGPMNRFADENVPAQASSRTPRVKGILKQPRYGAKPSGVLFGGKDNRKDNLGGSAAGKRTPLGSKTNKLPG